MANMLISSSLKVLLVTDLEKSKRYYRDVLGCEVTDWWVIRDGFTGLGLKLLQANTPDDVKPNKPAEGADIGFELYCYVDDWESLDKLYDEFKGNGANIVIEPWIDPDNGPWKEFALQDIDGYCIAFGGTNKGKQE
ncbi:VOC family protein [Cytobacillus sp. FJAT-54145]|uniref:VOC family protein n=1 Tax=Cytobacillus spartinae TaxID=3299023 RepID=A0ABW6KCW0_9BACI